MSAHGWADDPEFVARIQKLRRDHPAFPVGDYFPEVTHPDSVADVVALFRVEQAAPELLAIARDFLRLMDCSETRKHIAPTLVGTFDYYANNARAAIAKAEGIQ